MTFHPIFLAGTKYKFSTMVFKDSTAKILNQYRYHKFNHNAKNIKNDIKQTK